MKAPGMRVVIVGGGIGGIALAISLQHAGIEYVLVEKGEVLDPQVGASIGILPNASRILDQMGCLEELTALTVGMESTATHRADGSLIGFVSDTLKLVQRRTGYPVIFIDRQLLLRTLAHQIKDSHRIRLGTVAHSIEQYPDRAVVHCADGTQIQGDVIVGADGVHSIVRHEMWRHADLANAGAKFAKDKTAMSAEYKCLFGISNSIPGMQPGQTDRTYARDISTLSYVGKEGRVFWFVFMKMDQVYHPPHIPKFTTDDADAMVKEIGTLALREEGAVVVADAYRARICSHLVPIEEAAYQHWSYGRLVCLGDAVHKMTPNLGAGAASAIESAAALSNALVRAISASANPSSSVLEKHFKDYQTDRELRVGRAMGMTNTLTRVQALQTKMAYVFTHYIAPRADDYYAEAFSSFVIGAPVVEHLPVPAKSLCGTMPFNPKQGWGYEELTSARARHAWLLVVLALLSFMSSWPILHQLSNIGPALQYFGYQHDSATSKLGHLISANVTYGLWLLESTRLNNTLTLAQIPMLFGLLWLYCGQEGIVPLYFFVLYVFSPIEKFRAADNRLTNVSYTYCVAPLVLLLGVVPAVLTYSSSSTHSTLDIVNHKKLHEWMQFSQLLMPVSVTALQYLFSRVIRPSTIRSDRLWALHRDVIPIRCTTAVLAAVGATAWMPQLMELGTIGASGQGLSTAVPSVMQVLWHAITKGAGLTLTLSCAVWLALVFGDLKRAGMTRVGAVEVTAGALITTICLGPGTMVVLGWQWREEILIHRKHREAVVASTSSSSIQPNLADGHGMAKKYGA